MGNQVTLTFAGNTQDLETSFDRAGGAAEVMAVRVTDATNASAERFDHLSAQSSLLSGGIGDIGGALTTAFGEDTAIGAFGAKMEEASAIVTGFTGVMDLGVFATNNFKVASAAQAVQTGITSAATKAATAAQWLMNTALLASPITWIVVGIVALIAAIVLVAKKTDWFSKIWRASWDWIKKAASNTMDWFKKIPGWTADIFAKVAGYITKPYRAAFNLIADAWNNTVGGLSFTIPGWIPGIGGNSFSVPNIPHFHAGGTVPGMPGQAVPILAMAGETVSATGRGGGGGTIVIRGDGSQVADGLLELLRMAMLTRNGDPAAIGLRVER